MADADIEAPGTAAPLASGWAVDERGRAAAIAAHELASVRDHPALREITDFAAKLCDAPIALISIVEEARQFFLARTGFPLAETSRDVSFCAHAMRREEVMVVPDARLDPRFADNALVTGPEEVRFYAGAPLISAEGVPLGALCVIDTRPREGLTELQQQGLRVSAANIMARFRSLRDGKESRAAEVDARRAALDSESRFRTLANTMPQMVWSTLPDGYHDYYNARWYEFTGTPPGSTDGEGWNGMFHPDDQERAWSVWRHSLETGAPYQIEYRLRHHDGTYRWVLGRALPIRDNAGAITRWFGTCTDIHEQKLALEEREVISQELSHRIKNIFAVISGLISFAARSDPALAPVAADLRDRITALGRAHDFVRPHSATSRPPVRQDSLIGLLQEMFRPYQEAGATRIRVEGRDVAIDDRSATPLALLFHELATNASKYGALSTDKGRVAVRIEAVGQEIAIDWSEHDGPPVASPENEGFGSRLIELSAVRQLGGTVRREWATEGLRLRLLVPDAAFSRSAG